jgi:hypothetical protein
MSLFRFFQIQGNRTQKVYLVIYAIAYLGATYTHLSEVFTHGYFPYQRLDPNVSFWLNVYWTSLTLLDPLSIVILLINIQLGLFSYATIIITDVLINFSFAIQHYGFGSLLNFFQISQLSFLIFFAVTSPSIYSQIHKTKLITKS